MSTFFSTLIENARNLGVREAAQPIAVLEAAKLIAQHPDARANFDQIVALAGDPKNYFARWAAIRAINVMGPGAIRAAAPVLRDRLAKEGFDLAKRELKNALSKIENSPT